MVDDRYKDIQVLKFFAPWCAPCRVYARTFNKVMSAIDVDNVEINIDEDRKAADFYGVTTIPATIILKEGKIHSRKVGTMLYRDLETSINEAAGIK
jgi:thioredoxin 1